MADNADLDLVEVSLGKNQVIWTHGVRFFCHILDPRLPRE